MVVKPMTIDPVFWDLVGLPENRNLPLSFRLTGAWTCRPPYYAELQIEEDHDPSIVAGRVFAIADEQLDAVTQSYSMDGFLAACRAATERREGWSEGFLPSLIATLIATHREHEALELCESAHAKGQKGGFGAPEGSFVQMAAAWLRRSMGGATRH